MEKILNITPHYRDVEKDFNGIPTIFRIYNSPFAVYIKVDDNFARANGFATLKDLCKVDPMMMGVEWLDAEIFQHVAAIQQGNIQPNNLTN